MISSGKQNKGLQVTKNARNKCYGVSHERNKAGHVPSILILYECVSYSDDRFLPKFFYLLLNLPKIEETNY